jgi:hypothetical protein
LPQAGLTFCLSYSSLSSFGLGLAISKNLFDNFNHIFFTLAAGATVSGPNLRRADCSSHAIATIMCLCKTINICRIQLLSLSHLHCNKTIFISDICITTKLILKKFFKNKL